MPLIKCGEVRGIIGYAFPPQRNLSPNQIAEFYNNHHQTGVKVYLTIPHSYNLSHFSLSSFLFSFLFFPIFNLSVTLIRVCYNTHSSSSINIYEPLDFAGLLYHVYVYRISVCVTRSNPLICIIPTVEYHALLDPLWGS